MYRSKILPLANIDIREAAKWYNEKQQGLGKSFIVHIRKTVQYICRNPKAIAIRYDDTRTALLETFPYMIHYVVDEERMTVIILAVLNTSRNPKMWNDLLNS